MQPEPHQPQPPRRKPDIIGYLIIAALVLLALFVCVLPLFGRQMSTWVASLAPTCAIGVQGTSVVILVQSWSATDDCKELSSSQTNFAGTDFTGFGLSPISSSDVTGLTIQCEIDTNNRHVTVR